MMVERRGFEVSVFVLSFVLSIRCLVFKAS